MSFKATNKYASKTYHSTGSDLAKKRLENYNAKIRAKRELLEKNKGNLNKALISQIYKK